MRTIVHGTCIVAALSLSAVSAGCSQPASDQASANNSSSPSDAEEHDHEHDHDGHEHGHEHEGPHGGHVIELGKSHEYHAELVDDEQAETVTVYILDNDLQELPLEQQTLALNLIVDGAAQTFELPAAGAPGATASRFDAPDKAAFEALHEHDASGKLRATINGTPYSGVVHHDHDHDHDDDHNHDHDHDHDH